MKRPLAHTSRLFETAFGAPQPRFRSAGAFLFLCLLAVFSHCSRETVMSPAIVDKAFPGMHRIFSQECSFRQGADDSLASAADLERPSTTCSFGYDYWMDTVEVTQKDYASVTGRNPVPDSMHSGRGDDYPVSFVSWYDAILFCNAKSRKFDCDTVYSYSGKDTNSSGNVITLAGLIIHYDRSGWRLPTEAEWEFAAREGSSDIPFPHLEDSGSAKTFAWFDLNSSQHAHAVGRFAPNSWGLYDMAGNLFEWTADWKGPYSPVPIQNPIGAPNPDGYFEKTLKGGSFKHSFLFLRPSRRSGAYQTSLSTAADFIGFRCVRGAIPDPRYHTANTSQIDINPLAITASSVDRMLGTPRAKLAFVNVSATARILCVVDFGQSVPTPVQFTDVIDVYTPTISPDGRFVAYCSRGEGLDGPAKISIRSIDKIGSAPWKLDAERAYVPRWWIDRGVNDTFLMYTNSTMDNKSVEWPSTMTFLQLISGGKPTGAPQPFIASGSFHGGISPNRRYAVTGYTQCIMRDLIANAQRQIFVAPFNGKSATGSTQVCNVSISTDQGHPARCLFLDFGTSNEISALTRTAYGVHEYLFTADFSGYVVGWYKCPDAEWSWDYPEWCNKGRFAVACSRNAQLMAHAVHCIDLDTKNTLQLIEGTELSQPYLWIGDSLETADTGGLAVDSLGVYGEPLANAVLVPFSYKMHLFWKAHRNLDIAFVGNSLVQCGIDCKKLPEYTSINMGYPGAGLTACTTLIRNYILPSCGKIKLIGMSSGIYWMNRPHGEGDENAWTAIIQSKGYRYDLHHNFWRAAVPPRFDERIVEAHFLDPLDCDSLGMQISKSGSWGGASPDFLGGSDSAWKVSDTNYARNFAIIVNLIRDLAAVNVHLLMVNFPESPAYKNTDHYTRYGPTWETGRAVVKQLQALETTYSNFHFYDAYNDGNHDFSDADALNFNHLSSQGAAKLTVRLDSLIQTILGK